MSQPERPDRPHALLLRIAAATVAAGALSAYVIVAAGATPSPQTKNVVVSTAKNATVGTILVSGTTLYTLKASKTACAAACVKVWPEVLLAVRLGESCASPPQPSRLAPGLALHRVRADRLRRRRSQR